MKCPHCKASIDDNSKFCDYCGTKIDENSEKPIIKKDEITEEEYQKYYIGDNYYKFRNRFNIFALLFGGPYLFYRKQFIFGTIFILINVVTIFISPILLIILHGLLSITYNQQYLVDVNKKTRQIKIKNIDKSKEEILSICSEKGKPSMLYAIASIVIILILIVIILNIGGTNLKGSKGKTIVKVSDNKLNSLIFEVPEGFESGNYNTQSFRSYTYNENKNYCRIKIELRKDTGEFSSIETFLTNTTYTTKTDTVTTPENITINKQLWKRINVQSTAKTITYYATKYNDSYYIVSYDLYNNNSFCNEEYNKFMNTLNFRDN